MKKTADKISEEEPSYQRRDELTGALEKLRRIYEKAVKIQGFGNGRFVRKILEQAEMNLSDRVMELGIDEITPEALIRIEECDITDITPPKKDSERHIGFAIECA